MKFKVYNDEDTDSIVELRQAESILTILSRMYCDPSQENKTINLCMQQEGAIKYLELKLSKMWLDKEEFSLATFYDVTESKQLTKVENSNRVLSLLTASVTHEMVTPLKCIMNFAKSLEDHLKHSKKQEDAQLIFVTAKLLFSEIKLLLDKNLIDYERFEAQWETAPFSRIVSDTVQIMRQ